MKLNFFEPATEFIAVEKNGITYAIENRDGLMNISTNELILFIKMCYKKRAAKCIIGKTQEVHSWLEYFKGAKNV